jgi:hypothetical protein
MGVEFQWEYGYLAIVCYNKSSATKELSRTGKERQMKIQKQLQDILGGALGLVGMIESLLHDGKKGAAVAGQPPKGKGTGSKKQPVVKGETEEAKAKHSTVVKKKSVKKPVAAKKANPPPVEGKGSPAASPTRVKKAAASVPVKGGKKTT